MNLFSEELHSGDRAELRLGRTRLLGTIACGSTNFVADGGEIRMLVPWDSLKPSKVAGPAIDTDHAMARWSVKDFVYLEGEDADLVCSILLNGKAVICLRVIDGERQFFGPEKLVKALKSDLSSLRKSLNIPSEYNISVVWAEWDALHKQYGMPVSKSLAALIE